MSERVLALVVGHGDLAAGLVSAVAQITGRGELFLPLSNRDGSGAQLERTLHEALERTGAEVVFTDLPAGSWTLAARRVQRERPSMALVTGVNLAMLLDFAFHDALPAGEAAQAALEKGRGAITAVTPPATVAAPGAPAAPDTVAGAAGGPRGH